MMVVLTLRLRMLTDDETCDDMDADETAALSFSANLRMPAVL